MTSPLELTFWLYFLLFFIAIFFAFYIPGCVLLKKLSLTFFQKSILGLVVGLVLWGWQGFIFGYLGARWLSYFYLLAFFLIWLKQFRFNQKFFKVKRPKINSAIILIIIGTLLQVSIVWLTGVKVKDGAYFCCGAIGDNLYHLGITYELIKHFPPYEPDMYGLLITNYHYWAHLVVAEISRVFYIPFFHVEFQFLPIIISSFLGLLIIIFGQIAKLSKSLVFWIIYLLYFGGDFIYIIILAVEKKLNFQMGPLENGLAFLNNFPRSYAVIVFFAGLSLFTLWIKKKDLYSGLLMALLLGSAIGFKVYLGIFGLTGLFAFSLYLLYKRNFKMLMPCLLAFLLTAVIYLPVNKGSGGLFFTGVWRFEEFIVQPSLGLSHLLLAKDVFYRHNNWIKVYLYEFIFAFLFIFSIFGIKLLALIQNKKSLSILPREINIFLIPALFINIIAGLFFQQTSGGSNSFNFLVSVYIIGSIYAAMAVNDWINKGNKLIKVILIILVILSTIPRIAYEEYKNIKIIANKQGFFLNTEYLDAYRFIREKTEKSSLILPYYANYLIFLGERPTFLGDWGILESHSINTLEKRAMVNTVMTSPDESLVYKQLVENNINYLYMPQGAVLVSTDSARFLKTVFKNKQVKILKFYKHE